MELLTYIINLKTSTIRHDYMEKILEPYDFLHIEYIDAVDGRIMSKSALGKQFDYKESWKKYGRVLNNGEVGCTLSHRKCYEALICSNEEYALILEDDISIVGNLNIIKNVMIDQLLNYPRPRIVFLSGDYWFWNMKNGVAKVFSSVGSYAYLINKTAAKAILEKRAFTVADDWDYLRTLHVKYYAMYPYVIDANLKMDILSTDIQQDSWGIDKTKMGLNYLTKYLIDRVIKFILGLCKHFESKIRVINNVIVDN